VRRRWNFIAASQSDRRLLLGAAAPGRIVTCTRTTERCPTRWYSHSRYPVAPQLSSPRRGIEARDGFDPVFDW